MVFLSIYFDHQYFDSQQLVTELFPPKTADVLLLQSLHM